MLQDLGVRLARIESQLTDLDTKVDEIDHHLTGDGNPHKGLIVRVALIERMFKIFVGTAVTGTVALVLLLMKVMIG